VTSISFSPTATPESGYIETTPHRFPTALVAILLSLLSLFFLASIFLYLHYRPPPSGSWLFAWRWKGSRGVPDSEKFYKQDHRRYPTVDPIAEAIRLEEEQRVRKEKRGGVAAFYAPQVRHLVDLMGSKEELRVDVKRKGKRWPNS
jgi:hypothetical protein